MKRANVFLLLGFSFLILMSCEKDDPIVPNEEEVITTMIYTLTSTTDQSTAVLSFQDLDGDGGDAPIISTDNLKANTTYQASVTLLNELETPADNITLEVEEEDLEHQFFYISDVSGLTIDYDDMDSDGNPIGIQTVLTTSAQGNGTLTVILRHEPIKSATGVSAGDITNAGGESDIEVNFNVTIE